MFQELISNEKGLWLSLEKREERDGLVLTFRLKTSSPYLLHWGTATRRSSIWQAPAKAVWPEGSIPHGPTAVQTPFTPDAEGDRLVLRFPSAEIPPFLVFDLFSPETNRWENNRGRDFWVELSGAGPSPAAVLESQVGTGQAIEGVQPKVLPLDGDGELAIAVLRGSAQETEIRLVSDVEGPLLLHWGIQERPRSRWQQPSKEQQPPGTTEFDAQAVRTPFEDRDGVRSLTLKFAADAEPPGIGLLLFQPGTGRWLKHGGQDVFLKVSAVEAADEPHSDLVAEIVDGETGDHGWTLMHRFNLCHDLTDAAGEDRDAWAVLFVWLRYSAIRQLDWQRNYNTKPRELSHAQDRLTAKLAESFVRYPAQRDLIRSLLGSVGRGGDGQRIRDEILQIMHRHHIKEVGGTWMEQWHQKLHNNTTPDDIVICEAYLAFLRSDGNLDAYDATLLDGGVTRERLEGFERPITTNPEWHPHLKDGLIHDFEGYATLLRSVHAGTDLHTAADAGAHLLHGGAREALGFVQWHFRNPNTDAVELVSRITEARRGLAGMLRDEKDPDRVKDGLYLDLALEEALRTAIERQLQSTFDRNALLTLIDLVLENLLLVTADTELEQCHREWRRLPTNGRFSYEWCLHAKSTVDRLRRAVETMTDATYRLLQPKAERLGRQFQAAEWTVTLFSEEIIRGRPVFLLSMLLHHLDPLLRKGAKLGDWQVISPSRGAGVVHVVQDLRSLQGRTFDRPTVLVVEAVHGDEEPPDGVRAVITPRSVDLVSHVAVRARNASLLFATCFDPETFARLKKLDGRTVELSVTASGDVQFVECRDRPARELRRKPALVQSTRLPQPSLDVLRRVQFQPGLVGGKSWRIREMTEKLADAFPTPRSVALPFRVFDAVMAEPANRAVAARFPTLLREVQSSPEAGLAALRDCILQLQLPASLLDNLREAIAAEGFGVPDDFTVVGTRIKQVWASLWNDRAYFSRETHGLPHDSVSMAVLIQEVVPAEYAFVIHTVNPATGNTNEIYAEVVSGLGETLVGNYPGRATSFVVNRRTGQPTVQAFASKSIGLFGAGLIFRSDSNAEDLEGYAGAGLYDSVLLEAPREQTLDYTNDPLIWDDSFREQMFRRIATLAVQVEEAFGGPQDIEGAWLEGNLHVVQTRPQVAPHDESTSG